MQIIQLKPFGETKVDDDDYEWLRHFAWRQNPRTGYAFRNAKRFNEAQQKTVQHGLYLHRFIMEPCEPFFVDHKNGDKLDNRKRNLRLVLPIQNVWNRRYKKTKDSRYRGIVYRKDGDCWSSKIRVNGKSILLGRYNTEVEAAVAYDIACKEAYGDHAWLNFPKGAPIPPPIRRPFNFRRATTGLALSYPSLQGPMATIRIRGGTTDDQIQMASDMKAAWDIFHQNGG